MAPVVCMTDNFPMPRTDAAYPYARRRQRNRLAIGIVENYRTVEMRQMSMARARVGTTQNVATPSACPISLSRASSNENCRNNALKSSISPRIPIEREEQWIILKRRAGLLNIVARTLDLMRRNHILEKKVQALRLETRGFVNSVLDDTVKRTKSAKIRETALSRRDEITNDAISSATNEKSSWTTAAKLVAAEHRDEKSRSRIGNDDPDHQSFTKTDMMLVH